jgi:hypothetical protein
VNRDELKQAIAAAALGDEDSIDQLATALHQALWSSTATSASNGESKAEFKDNVNEFRSRNRDLVSNATAWADVVKVDAHAVAQAPELASRQRLEVVGAFVRGGGAGGAAELDADLARSLEIQEIAQSRRLQARGDESHLNDDDQGAIDRMVDQHGRRRARTRVVPE